MNLVLMGPPGAGKGTQGEILSKRLDINTISTGVMLRTAIKEQSEIGKMAEKYINDGKLVPDDVIVSIVKERLQKPDCAKGFILDGFPRTIPQAKALKKMLADRNSKVHAVVGLEVDDNELVDRLLKRGKESGRSDDNLETINKRLEVYHNQTSPLRDYYKQEGKYHAIHGSGSIDDIFESIKCSIAKATKE